jgi:hypothetical protein
MQKKALVQRGFHFWKNRAFYRPTSSEKHRPWWKIAYERR